MSAYSDEVLLDSPVAYWRLDEASGNVSSLVGSFTSTSNLATMNAVGRIGTCAEFDGTTDYINFAHNASLSFGSSGAFTASAFIKPDLTHSGIIVGKGANHEWKMYTTTGGGGTTMLLTCEIREVSNNRIYQGSVDLAPLVGSWIHVAVTYSGANTRARMYVNGVLDVERTAAASFNTNTRAVRIGATDAGTVFFNGKIDEVALFNTELTGARIAAHYAARDGADPAWAKLAWIGGVTDDAATVAVELSAAEDVRLEVSTSASFTSPSYSSMSTGATRAKLAVSGLTANTDYFWRLEIDGAPTDAAGGVFKTFPAEGTAASFSFAAASCAGITSGEFTSNAAVWDTLAGLDTLFFMHLGDLHYRDETSTAVDDHRENYRQVLANSRQRNMWRRMPIAYTWSNHDFGGYDGAGAAYRAAALEAYRDMVPHYPTMVGAADDTPIAQTFVCGRVRVVMLDVHTDRTSTTRFLSAAQIAWLANILQTATERLLVLQVASAWIGGSGEEAWQLAGTDRVTVANLINDNGWTGRTLILHGDAHQIAMDDGTNSQYATGSVDPGPAVACLAPIERTNSNKGGPYSEGVADTSAGQYGVITIAEQLDGTMDVTVSGFSTLTPSAVGPLAFTVPAAITASGGAALLMGA